VDWEIHLERPEDYDAVRQVLLDAFTPSTAEANLVESIRVSPWYVDQLTFVATVDNEVVGALVTSHAGLRPAPSSDGAAADRRPPPSRLVLTVPLAVRHSHQGRGVASALMRSALDAAEIRGEPVVLGLGDSAFYRKFGFESAVASGFVVPAGIRPEAFLVRRLSGWDVGVRGEIVLAPAFDGILL
jgi:putative acetyltransferase